MIVTGPAAIPACPYKGLVPYSEEDAPFFFGREDEQEIIAANLQAYRLTLLYGPSGVGKSSVLRAGVAHHLRQATALGVAPAGAAPDYVVVVFSSWRDDPIARLIERVRSSVVDVVPAAADADRSGSLIDTLARWTTEYNTDLLIILDQFEEYFLYHADDTFAHEFSRAVTSRELRVNFLVSIRDDALAKLDRFKGRIPSLFDNYLRIDHLDRDAASEAIDRPVEQFNRLRLGQAPPMTIEPALREAVLDQLGTGRVVLGSAGRGEGVTRAAAGRADDRIETPFLQLVMTRLWKEEEEAGSSVLRLETLTRLGGAERIVRTHLDAVMGRLTQGERQAAARAFRYLVTPSGTKIAHTLSDLAEYSGVPQAQLEPLVEQLSSGAIRIVRPVAPPPGQAQAPRYEIFHDVLAAAIADWRGRMELERRAEIETVLRPLHRGAWVLGGRFLLATALVAAPLVAALMEDPDSSAWSIDPGDMSIVALAGLFLMIAVSVQSERRTRKVVAAVGSGFSWSAITDVLADRHGDIGDVVAGDGQYEDIAADIRDRIRFSRRLQAGLMLLAAMAPAAGIVAVVALGSRKLMEPSAVFAVAVVPTLLLLLGVLLLRAVNVYLVWSARRRPRALQPAPRARQRVHDSFEGLASAEPSPSELGRARTAGKWWDRAVSLLVFATLLAAAPFMLWTVIASILAETAVPGPSNFEERMRIRQAGIRLAPDPAITALAAGRAYYTLMDAGRSVPPQPYEHAVPRSIAAVTVPDEKDTPFGEDATAVFDTLMKRAVSGFTDSQRQWLERLAAFEGLEEAAVVARAARIDYVGARLKPDHPVTSWDFPVYGGPRQVLRPYLARAALDLADQQPAQAEMTLREMISFAVVMIDEAHSALECLVGAVILENGLKSLEQLYAETGAAERAEAMRFQREAATALRDEPDSTARGTPAPNRASMRRTALDTAADPARLRGERWEALAVAGFFTCINAREVLFGPGDRFEAAFEAARSTLVRFPGEQRLLDNIRAGGVLGPMPVDDSRPTALSRLVRLSAGVVYGEGILRCPIAAGIL